MQAAVQANYDKFHTFFGADIVENPMQTMNRNAFVPEERSLCESYTMVKFPKSAQNVNGDWNYIVNDEKNFTQGIRVEMCA